MGREQAVFPPRGFGFKGLVLKLWALHGCDCLRVFRKLCTHAQPSNNAEANVRPSEEISSICRVHFTNFSEFQLGGS